MNLTLRRVLIFILLVALSVGVGFSYDAIATAVEKKQHPMPSRYAPLIEEQAKEFGVPAAIIWAVVRCESDFASDAVAEDGAVGLMQITPQQMEQVYSEIFCESIPDQGILYDPKTNLRIGTARLSQLYQTYGVWDTVYVAWYVGTETVDGWLLDDEITNEQGQLANIPHKATAKFVTSVKKSAKMYTELYYTSQPES